MVKYQAIANLTEKVAGFTKQKASQYLTGRLLNMFYTAYSLFNNKLLCNCFAVCIQVKEINADRDFRNVNGFAVR
jgi:hypothetical protein